jgi:hypothetical protein
VQYERLALQYIIASAPSWNQPMPLATNLHLFIR